MCGRGMSYLGILHVCRGGDASSVVRLNASRANRVGEYYDVHADVNIVVETENGAEGQARGGFLKLCVCSADSSVLMCFDNHTPASSHRT